MRGSPSYAKPCAWSLCPVPLWFPADLSLADSSDIDLDSDDHEKRRTRYPFAACEVFCCEVDAILTTLLESEALMSKYFRFLSNPAPLSAVTAGYFSRVLTVLLVRRPQEALSYLLDHEEVRQVSPRSESCSCC